MNLEKPVLSVGMIAYNHAEYIEEAINGVLMQETAFEYELVISNDNSTDDTNAVVREILQSHPQAHRIRYYNHEKNMGMIENLIFNFNHCRGKYIAVCEGDDYWIDKTKLQKQVDFLNSRPEFSLCIHNGQIYNEEKKSYTDFCISKSQIINKCELNPDYVFKARGVMAPTASFVFRTKYLNESFYELLRESPAGDFVLILMMVLNGKIGYINEKMSVYRVSTSNGSWTSSMQKIDARLAFATRRIDVWSKFDNLSNGKYKSLVRRAISVQYSTYIHGLGRLATKKEQIKAMLKYKKAIFFVDYLYIIPRILLRKNKIL